MPSIALAIFCAPKPAAFTKVRALICIGVAPPVEHAKAERPERHRQPREHREARAPREQSNERPREQQRESRPAPLADPSGRGFDDDQVPAFLLRGLAARGVGHRAGGTSSGLEERRGRAIFSS